MATTTRAPKGDKAVRDYLAFLNNPSEFVDKRLLNRLQSKYDKIVSTPPEKQGEDAPVELMDLYLQIQEASIPDGSKVEEAFIKNAFAWSESTGITAEAFIEVHNVPRSVLKAAGFPVRATVYKPRVTGEQVRACIAEQKEPFLVADIAEMTGASDAGVRNVIRDLIEEQIVEALPKQPVKKGKAPVRYQVV